MSEADKIQLAGELFLERRKLEGETGSLRAKIEQMARRLHQLGDSLSGVIDQAKTHQPPGEYIQTQASDIRVDGVGQLIDEYRTKAARLEEVRRNLDEIG